MKALLFIIGTFAAGFLLGRVPVPENFAGDNVDQKEPVAITYSGPAGMGEKKALDLLTSIPKGGNYLRADFLAWLKEANENNDRELKAVILREWAAVETEEGIRAVFAIGDSREGWQLLTAWVEVDPAAAAMIAFEIPSNDRDECSYFDNLISTSISRLLKRDPEKAVEIESRFHSRGGFSGSLVNVDFRDWDREGQRDALKAIAEFEDPWRKRRFAENIFNLGYADSKYSVEWIDSNIALPQRESAYEEIIASWLQKDREAVAQFVASRMDGTAKSRGLLRQFLRKTAIVDSEFLSRWMKEQDPELLRDAAPIRWYGLLPGTQQELAERLGPGFEWVAPVAPDHPRRQQASYTDLPAEWPPESQAEAGAWLEFLHNPQPGIGPEQWTIESVNDALALQAGETGTVSHADAKKVAALWSSHDPRAAIEWAAQLPGNLMIETAETVVANWFENEPQAALDYVGEMPEGEFRSYAVERVAKDWLERDPEPAIKWVNQMPRGLDKDLGRQQVVDAFLDRNPKRSFFQANAIDHPVIREEALEASLRRWMARDPTEVLEFLPEANLDESLRAVLRAQAKKNEEARREILR